MGGRWSARLDTLACGASPHVFCEGREHTRPPHQAPGEGKGLVPTEVTTQRRGLELLQNRATQVIGRGDGKTVASGTHAVTVEWPVAHERLEAGAGAPGASTWALCAVARRGPCSESVRRRRAQPRQSRREESGEHRARSAGKSAGLV